MGEKKPWIVLVFTKGSVVCEEIYGGNSHWNQEDGLLPRNIRGRPASMEPNILRRSNLARRGSLPRRPWKAQKGPKYPLLPLSCESLGRDRPPPLHATSRRQSISPWVTTSNSSVTRLEIAQQQNCGILLVVSPRTKDSQRSLPPRFVYHSLLRKPCRRPTIGLHDHDPQTSCLDLARPAAAASTFTTFFFCQPFFQTQARAQPDFWKPGTGRGSRSRMLAGGRAADARLNGATAGLRKAIRPEIREPSVQKL